MLIFLSLSPRHVWFGGRRLFIFPYPSIPVPEERLKDPCRRFCAEQLCPHFLLSIELVAPSSLYCLLVENIAKSEASYIPTRPSKVPPCACVSFYTLSLTFNTTIYHHLGWCECKPLQRERDDRTRRIRPLLLAAALGLKRPPVRLL